MIAYASEMSMSLKEHVYEKVHFSSNLPQSAIVYFKGRNLISWEGSEW